MCSVRCLGRFVQNSLQFWDLLFGYGDHLDLRYPTSSHKVMTLIVVPSTDHKVAFVVHLERETFLFGHEIHPHFFWLEQGQHTLFGAWGQALSFPDFDQVIARTKSRKITVYIRVPHPSPSLIVQSPGCCLDVFLCNSRVIYRCVPVGKTDTLFVLFLFCHSLLSGLFDQIVEKSLGWFLGFQDA